MTNELLAAEQLINLLSIEKHKLMADYRQLKHRCDIQKDATDTLQKQLDEKTAIVTEKDRWVIHEQLTKNFNELFLNNDDYVRECVT